jgi:transcriptional regulator with XRE-family HTH domain
MRSSRRCRTGEGVIEARALLHEVTAGVASVPISPSIPAFYEYSLQGDTGQSGLTRHMTKRIKKIATTRKKDKPEKSAAFADDYDQPTSLIVRRIGEVIHQHRKLRNLTIAQLAAAADMSTAMLSRVENGIVSASYENLDRLCKGVGLTLADLFAEISISPEGNAQLVRANERMDVVRTGTRHGHVYQLLSYDKGHNKSFESFYITMDKKSETYPRFRHPGTEFIFMLRGSMDYRFGDKVFRINPGDAFTFSGGTFHGPEKLYSDDIHFICMIVYGDD